MITSALTVTFNETIRADTFNVPRCPAQSTWCKTGCYGNKLTGLGFFSPWDNTFVFGQTAHRQGYLRPFTVRGDLPALLEDRRLAVELFNRLLPLYNSVWIPTRTWSLEDGPEFISILLDIHPNLSVMLSFDGSMDPEIYLGQLNTLRNYGTRVKASAVIDAPNYTKEEVARLRVVTQAMRRRYVCPKTSHAGTCSTCGRLCWNLRKFPGKSSIILFGYHK